MDHDAQTTQGDEHPLFHSVPSVTVEGLRSGVHAWTTSAPMRALVEEFGSSLPIGHLQTVLEFLDDFSGRHWDFRDQTAPRGEPGVERHHVTWPALTPDREELVIGATRALGLVEPRPPTFPQYDHLLILGGRARANRRRSLFAAHLARHVLRCRQVTGIGSFRSLSQASDDNESTRLEEHDMPLRAHEAAMLQDAMQAAFFAGDFSSAIGHGRGAGAQHIESATAPDGISLTLVAAPSSPTGKRADTKSSMTHWAHHVADMQPGQRILNITTSIYAPYQQAVALEALAVPFRVHVETIGVDDSVIVDGREPPHFTATQYLQEIRSTIRSYRSLLASIG